MCITQLVRTISYHGRNSTTLRGRFERRVRVSFTRAQPGSWIGSTTISLFCSLRVVLFGARIRPSLLDCWTSTLKLPAICDFSLGGGLRWTDSHGFETKISELWVAKYSTLAPRFAMSGNASTTSVPTEMRLRSQFRHFKRLCPGATASLTCIYDEESDAYISDDQSIVNRLAI